MIHLTSNKTNWITLRNMNLKMTYRLNKNYFKKNKLLKMVHNKKDIQQNVYNQINIEVEYRYTKAKQNWIDQV